ncbi:Membrane-associated phospholipid phosphatase [Halapricum desulfuricans]|uniref:Membrane-associated phospholipid phosphatase n=1 Tax=Halapricum desulfuricans TaxID=2841257 RepID=A0A897ND80_9EURY|nr:Membrane-associated phospholipid phosphatase [Halapricum desulfuricans]
MRRHLRRHACDARREKWRDNVPHVTHPDRDIHLRDPCRLHLTEL